MCGRYTLRSNLDRILREFALTAGPPLTPRYNIAPTQQVPVIRTSDGKRQLSLVRWGLIPSWSRDEKIGNRMINARAETADEKPSFRTAFRRRRCLVVADGFYEWKRTGSGKQPYYIRMKEDRPFAFAGLWEAWWGPKGQRRETPLESCTILTTEPNELMQSLHDRMPAILSPGDYDLWLDAEFDGVDALKQMLHGCAADEMTAFPISTLVNNPRNETAACLEPLAE